jgi:RNA polymerase sigma-70 factor, ECF subfamily
MKTDADLVLAAMAGLESAYRELLARYERPVFTLVLRMVRDRSEAEDLAQEAFIKAFEKLASFDVERKFSSWLFKIAHNTTIDHLRRRGLHTVSLDAPIGDDDSGTREVADPDAEQPSARVEREALNRALTSAIGQLRPEYRQVMLLRFQAGLEYVDIADTTGLPLGTVKTYLHRARKELAERLAAAGYGDVT